MKKQLLLVSLFFFMLFFNGCTSKQLKRSGFEIATMGRDPVSLGVGLAVGGTIIGAGFIVEQFEDENNDFEQEESE